MVVAEGMAGLFRHLITSHDLNHKGPSVDFRSFFLFFSMRKTAGITSIRYQNILGLLTPNSNVAGHVYLLDFHLLILANEE